MMKTLFICSLLTIPLLGICFGGEFLFTTDVSQYLLLTQFSVGNLGESLDGWNNLLLDDILKLNVKEIGLSCNIGSTESQKGNEEHIFKLVGIENFGLTPEIINNQTQFHKNYNATLFELEDKVSCDSYYHYFLGEFRKYCHDQESCVIQTAMEDNAFSACKNMLEKTVNKKKEKKQSLYMTVNYRCIEAESILILNNSIIYRKALISFFWVTWDCLILLLIAFFFYRLNFFIKKESNRIKKNRMTADYYTVQIRNLPKIPPGELYGQMFQFFETLSPKAQVADIGFGMGDRILNINFEIGKLKRRLAMVENELLKDKEPDSRFSKRKVYLLEIEHKEITKRIKELNEKQETVEASSKMVKTAFVSFMMEEGAQYIVYNYTKFANSNKLFRLFRQKKIKKF